MTLYQLQKLDIVNRKSSRFLRIIILRGFRKKFVVITKAFFQKVEGRCKKARKEVKQNYHVMLSRERKCSKWKKMKGEG
jgi:hypothetical protein